LIIRRRRKMKKTVGEIVKELLIKENLGEID